jgi:acetyl esterase/lipase
LFVTITAVASATPSSAIDTPNADQCPPGTGVTCVFGIAYEDDGNPVHTLDAYYPTDLTDRATVVMIHGGRWKNGDSSSYAQEALYFAENGFAVFSINYTLSQRGIPSWPEVRTDVESATAWVIGHADKYHGDDSRVAVFGGSSGGHLAALVDTDGPDHGAAPVAAVTWSGMMDLKITYKQGNGAARNGIYHLLGCRPNGCPRTYAAASPDDHVSSDDGSLLFFHSQDERVPIAGARKMNRLLAAAGVPHELVVLKHSTEHARQYECDPITVDGETLPVIDDSMRWLGTQLDQPTTPNGTFCHSSRR